MNGLAILRKYSISPLSFVKPSPFEGIISFTVNGRITLTEGAYLTSNEMEDTEEAHKYLAITYSPKFENIFNLTKQDLIKFELRNPYFGKEPTRIWPAFGLHGGACEIMLTRGILRSTESKEKFPQGGQFDYFCQDSTKSDKIFVSVLIQKMYEWLQGRKDEFYPKEGLGGKTLDGLGNILSWIGIPSYKRYAVSCAYKENKNRDFVKLKFWGYVWDDKNDKRVLSKPIIREHSLLSGIDDVKDKIKQHQDPLSGIENILSDINDCLIPIAQNFENCDNDTVRLPPYVCIICQMHNIY